ncbi:transferase [bacterium]|nr:transferase [bacterium]
MDDNKSYVLGIGRNTVTFLDLCEDCDYGIAGLYHYNNERTGEDYSGYRISGCFEDLLLGDIKGVNFVLSMGDIPIRAALYKRIIEKGGVVPNLIHISSVVSRRSTLGNGVVIMPLSVVQAEVTIGNNVVITVGSIISHSSTIGNNVFISGNCIVGAYVNIGRSVQIGQGCTIVSDAVQEIGDNSILGAGSVLRSNMRPDSIYLGNPARFIKSI